MGYRTLVMLYNDQSSDWENDPLLGKKIAERSSRLFNGPDGNLGYGSVVECVHADRQTLAVIDSYQFKPIAYDCWQPGLSDEAIQLNLIKQAAAKLGYKLVKE